MISFSLFFHSIQGMLTIIIMFMTGYFVSRAGWIDEGVSKTFAKIILNVSLPCYMVFNLMTNFSKNLFESLAGNLFIPFITIFISYILSIIISNIFKIKSSRKGVFRTSFFASNTIFIGLPINLALFGPKSIPYALLYYIANTTFFWTIGTYEMAKDGDHGSKVRFFSKLTIKRVLSPALLGFITAIILIFLQITLPDFVMKSCQYIGDLTTPLAMIFIGFVLFSVKIRKIRLEYETILIIVARFVICPLLVLLLTYVFKTPSMIAKVFIIQAAMPAMTSTSIVSKEYGSDYEFSTKVIVVTTVLSMVVIPIYMVLI